MKTIRNKLYTKKKYVKNFVRNILHKKFFENNVDNLYYGHYSILRKYSKVLFPYKINGEVQHGWASKSGITSADLNSNNNNLKLERFYVFNARNKKLATKAGYNNVIPIGAPFLYIKNPEKYHSVQAPKSLLVFPTHTHEFNGPVDTLKVYKHYIDDIKKIASYFSNISVSLYWKEFKNQKIINLFKRERLPVICMGHRDNNPNFLINFINQVSKYEYVSSDNFSSAIFYSLFMQKKVFIYSNAINDSKIFSPDIYSNHLKSFSKTYSQLLWENFDHVCHSYIANEELGIKYKLTPNELRKVFEWGGKSLLQTTN